MIFVMSADVDFKAHVRQVLARHKKSPLKGEGFTRAAILVPLYQDAGVWHLLFTLRTDNVEHHKGQVSFPGGACDPDDPSPLHTALRETHEEIGVRPEDVEVLGELDDAPTVTNFIVTPFVGVIPYPYDFKPNSDEIAELFGAPLDFFRDPANLRLEDWTHKGRPMLVPFYDYGRYTIWGFTARVVRQFLEILDRG
jgi:8-oxo-dGTP pyrophosphatase MutT (NUDIX family)